MNKLYVEIDQDTFLKLVESIRPHKLEAGWVTSIVKHVISCDKWRGENGIQI